MADALHRAIQDALRDTPAYRAKDIRVGLFLDATRPLEADGSLLHTSVYTIFRALPDRLLAGSTLNVATSDTDEGVELIWEGREPLPTRDPESHDLRVVLGQGPYGDLVEIAVVALTQFCKMRAGFVETRREEVSASTSFARPAYLIRRVVAHMPACRKEPGAVRAPPGSHGRVAFEPTLPPPGAPSGVRRSSLHLLA